MAGHKEKSRSFFSRGNDQELFELRKRRSQGKYCDKIVKPEDRKKIIAEKHLCFNGIGAKHRAGNYKSKNTCQICPGN